MSYLEPLPTECPPDDAEEICEAKDVFRLVRTDPPSPDDFRSKRAENPAQVFPGVTECQARGLSVFTEREDAVRKVLKLPKFRGWRVCRVSLKAGAGTMQQTFQPSHHTWWPLAAFEILPSCGVEPT